jgi:hypothetical protein
LSLFLPATILACLIAAEVLSMGTWGLTGPLLLFLGLLTLLNAPFDWASLGLTRALLRRGLELGGWWPYLLALVDAALATVIIACLALVMVIGVQAFDELGNLIDPVRDRSSETFLFEFVPVRLSNGAANLADAGLSRLAEHLCLAEGARRLRAASPNDPRVATQPLKLHARLRMLQP